MVATRSGTDNDRTSGDAMLRSAALESLVAALTSAITTAIITVLESCGTTMSRKYVAGLQCHADVIQFCLRQQDQKKVALERSLLNSN